MEAVVDQNRIEVGGGRRLQLTERDLAEARSRVEAYLRVWRLPDSIRDEITELTIAKVQASAGSAKDALAIAMDEVEKGLQSRAAELLTASIPPLTPQREPETHPMTMETSLTRLPSFRIIAGWFVLIAMIVLAFIFTR